MHIKEIPIQEKVNSAHNILRAEFVDNKAFIEALVAKQIITGEEFTSLIQLLKQAQQKPLKSPNSTVSLK
jgi:hypothetical protein